MLATTAAVASVPSVYFRVAGDMGLRGCELLRDVTLPAIMPQVITRCASTVGVVVDGRRGRGDDRRPRRPRLRRQDARNGLRMDLLGAAMIVIGVIGVVLDRLLAQLTRIPSVRWGYER